MQLRDYQIDAVETLLCDSARASLAVLATGLGKTRIMGEMLRVTPNARSLFIVDSVDLLDQTAARFRELELPLGIYCGSRGKQTGASLTIATIQSVLSSPDAYETIYIDETHGFVEEKGRYQALLQKHPSAKIYGFTATPFRSNGYIYGSGKLYPRITFERGIQFGIDNGWLVRPVLRGSLAQFDISKLKVVRGEYDQAQVGELVRDSRLQIVDALLYLQERKKVLWFCSNIKHAEHVHEHLPDSVVYHSELSREERIRAKDAFENGIARHLIFVSTLAKGYDYPPADALVILRPTRSPTLWVQVAGRVLRTYPGKENALILDYARVAETLGPLDDPIVKQPSKKRGDSPPPMKMCPACFLIIRAAAPACECGFTFPIKLKPLSIRAATSAKLLKSEGELFETDIQSVSVTYHRSRNGNECVRLDYRHDLLTTHTEYMVKAFWNEKNIKNRLTGLGVPRIPTTLKYPKKVKMKFQKTKYGVKLSHADIF